MKRLIDPLREILSRAWIAEGVALAGGALYAILALADASSRESFLDEGLYLYKGWLFISGRYTPFQDYGLWTNHMPYSYLIAGIVQYLFGPSLQVGRIFSILLSLLALLGLWLLTRRLSNRWLAAAVIWAMALNTAEIKIFTIAISQSLIAFLMVWTLVLTVGEKRSYWQVGLGALLASLMLMARINMTIVLPLVVIYVFWQHGKTAGIVAAAAGGLGILLGHALFWPDILKLWAAWLPRALTPFLDGFRLFTNGTPYQTYEQTGMGFWQERMLYFWMSIRLHPAAFMAAITAWTLWPAVPAFKSSANFKPAVFLSILLGTLWAMHAYAALGPKSFCVSCMIMYVGFFDYLGLLLLAGVLAELRFELSPLRKIAIVATVLLLTTGVLYSGAEDLKHFTVSVMRTEVPRVKSFQLLPETIELRVLLHNKYQLPEEAEGYYPFVPPIAGFLFGAALLLASLIYRAVSRSQASFALIAIVALTVTSLILSPTVVLSQGNDFFACSGVLAGFEQAAQKIRETIPRGERVYWEGRTLAIFLYLPDLQIYPPQLNHIHNLYIGGDPDPLLRMGYWNDRLARSWLDQSDYALIEKVYMQGWEQQILYSGQFTEIEVPRLGDCRGAARISIFHRK